MEKNCASMTRNPSHLEKCLCKAADVVFRGTALQTVEKCKQLRPRDKALGRDRVAPC